MSAKLSETGKQYDLVVATYQMCILGLFNTNTQLTYDSIKSAMKFDDETCTKNLKSLMFQKFKILERKGEDSGPFTPNEII